LNPASIREAMEAIADRHRQYIEANYHLWHPRLIRERRRMMEEGETNSDIWVEATPTYLQGKRIIDLNLPKEVKNVFQEFVQLKKSLIIEKPYEHQSEALLNFFNDKKNLIVSTGTGSGKTEIFLYSILGLLAEEASRSKTQALRGVRAIILYPMNALVSDQLARVRKLFGSKEAADVLQKMYGRRVQFGMYTSRTPYHGVYDPKRNNARVKPLIQYFIDLQQNNPILFNDLLIKGKVPSKDIKGFLGGRSNESRFRTQPSDSELLTRQEMHKGNEYGGVPDILITNYSMLEYMLLRPIEQPFFESTRNWLSNDVSNQLLIVIDEAHLYRGAQGAEVAMLIRRLLQHLKINTSQVRFILSSASLGTKETAYEVGPKFGSDLTSCKPEDFSVITGKRITLPDPIPGDLRIANIFKETNYRFDSDRIGRIAKEMQWPSPVVSGDGQLEQYVGNQFKSLGVFKMLYNLVTSRPIRLDELSSKIFPGIELAIAEESTLNLLFLGSQATGDSKSRLLPARAHRFFKGLPKLFVCINPDCSKKRIEDDNKLLGRIYTEPRFQCECGSRVFELLSHRTCGAAYIRAFRRKKERELDPIFLWDEIGTEEESFEFDEIHILVESPRKGEDIETNPPSKYLDVLTGHLFRNPPSEEARFIRVWVPTKPISEDKSNLWSWSKCPACGIEDSKQGGLKIMDLETKGEEIFANIVKNLFQFQPEAKGKEKFPNRGKKVLAFSDGRQKAARFARDLQRTVERDSFREIIIENSSKMPSQMSMNYLFPAFVVSSAKYNIGFFDDEDNEIGGPYPGSRSHLLEIQKSIPRIAFDNDITEPEISTNATAAEDLNNNRPPQYDISLLRILGDKYFSIYTTTIGYLEPTKPVMDALIERNKEIEPELLRSIIIEILRKAAEKRFFDDSIRDDIRRQSRATLFYPFGYPIGKEDGYLSTDIIPEDLRKRLGTKISQTAWDRLSKSVRSYPKEGVQRLFTTIQTQSGSERFVINQKAVRIHVALDEKWYRCAGCRQYSPIQFGQICPQCGGKLLEIDAGDIHFEAKKTLLREPCIEIISGKRRPFTLRSEEHSAQVSAKDNSKIFSKSEDYELLFQDIILQDKLGEQPIDVLSCTTTMEVGIDIGSLTGIAMRTVPPLSSNYQQRSGRAGRRGSALSTIVTFADNSPHETFCFKNPGRLIGSESPKPSIYIGNRKICQRHINATLIQMFFQAAPISETADVFSSLGPSKSFFKGNGEYSLIEFINWIDNKVFNLNSSIVAKIVNLLPDELADSSVKSLFEWKSNFVRESAKVLIDDLKRLSTMVDFPEIENEEDNLLSTLLDATLLPTFSFPINVCTFSVQDLDPKLKRIITRYEPSEDLRQALSEYAPGRSIVIDKMTYSSYGLHFPYSKNLINRALSYDWDNLIWLNYCDSCESVRPEKDRPLNKEEKKCQICGSKLSSIPMVKPSGFSPEVEDFSQRSKTGEKKEEERSYATSAKFPLPSGGVDIVESATSKMMKNGIAYRRSNQELSVVNFGPSDNGYEICKLCGAIGTPSLSNPHNRPYPRAPAISYREWTAKCQGGTVKASLGYKFQTDVAILRMINRKPLSLAFSKKWFRDTCTSLSEALVLGATRTLDIDTDEISGGSRILPRLPLEDSEDINGYIEFFLYDTTPGGAGFVISAFESTDKIIETTLGILENCKCNASCHSCLRTYQNRRWHGDLDRFLAASFLRYIRDGEIPSIPEKRLTELIRRLTLTLGIMDSKISVTRSNQDSSVIIVNDGIAQIEVKFVSCMLAQPPMISSGIYVSDYDLIHNLPKEAHQIMDALKKMKK